MLKIMSNYVWILQLFESWTLDELYATIRFYATSRFRSEYTNKIVKVRGFLLPEFKVKVV